MQSAYRANITVLRHVKNRKLVKTKLGRKFAAIPAVSHNSHEFQDILYEFEIDWAVHLGTSRTGLRGLFSDERTLSSSIVNAPLSSCLIVSCNSNMHSNKNATVSENDEVQAFVQMASLLLNLKFGKNDTATTDKGSSSKAVQWKRYIQKLLPREPEMTCLLSFNRKEALELQVPELLGEWEKQRSWMMEVHEHHLSAHLPCSIEDSAWALAVARSRSIGFKLEGGHHVMILPPAIDMANHASASACNAAVYLDKAGGKLMLRPVRPVDQDEEILIDFGHQRSNLDLMTDYGFIIPGNEADRISFSISSLSAAGYLVDPKHVQEALHQLAQQKRYIGDVSTTPKEAEAEGRHAINHHLGRYSEHVSRSSRRRAAASSLLQLSCNAGSDGESVRGESNRENSRSCYQNLEAHIQHKLNALPSTVEEDRRELGDLMDSSLVNEKLPSARYMLALRARLEHKRLLLECIEILREMQRAVLDQS
ncbi:hypothetical protein CEUSTIGMA_g3194.t1 [Chlamydomonas eustigma]|uniref:SET domain-containing protein n=1 Tax=Chlamydomonas eustigma TaxID=1157962 RepID=A0A250WY48_9CHLO|nr:hypothetical protein CEUSTIGMA_g3194.t1 [Chlamydomonas eustigma]|eukprot:GAX75751.1 hypothetical protein CEUSTIGMA_g3194.t1 [Chlamydomonas eustigma]